MPIALQGHNGLDGLKGQPGAQGVKVNTELRTRFVSNSFKSSNTTKKAIFTEGNPYFKKYLVFSSTLQIPQWHSTEAL